MQPVTMEKSILLQTIQDNRAKHAAIYTEAMETFRTEAIAQMQKHLEEAQSGGKIRLSLKLSPPENHLADYDRAIKMLEMSLGTTISVTEHEFQTLVLDEWGWKRQFTLSNIAYSKSLQDANPALMEED